MKIAVFCSGNEHIAPEYFRAAEALGRWIGEHGHTLVYGGQDQGLMRSVAEAAHAAGAQVTGVVPRTLMGHAAKREVMDVDIPCDNLGDRKAIMMRLADHCVALPGGLGTLDEVFTVAGSNTVGDGFKPMTLLDVGGFWAPLSAFLDKLEADGFIRGHWRDNLNVASSLDDLATLVAGTGA